MRALVCILIVFISYASARVNRCQVSLRHQAIAPYQTSHCGFDYFYKVFVSFQETGIFSRNRNENLLKSVISVVYSSPK